MSSPTRASGTQPDLSQERTWVGPALQPLEESLPSSGQRLCSTCSVAGWRLR